MEKIGISIYQLFEKERY